MIIKLKHNPSTLAAAVTAAQMTQADNANGTTDCVSQECAPSFWGLSLATGLVNDILAGDYLSFHGYAADDQVVYLVNQLTKPGAHPQIFISAEAGPAPVPLPGAVWLLLSAFLFVLGFSKRAGAPGRLAV